MKSWAPCDRTGFIVKINCAKSNKVEYKSCRSSRMEESLFWRFPDGSLGPGGYSSSENPGPPGL
ncbi:hypothetical protein J4Q44_G00026310 [Coregonus suidteri]|uniref:Uncharacterized protein n=1 Tax=Coregonus suidteri TaxID=861788 RepID=A0AAN8NGG3_9TELE